MVNRNRRTPMFGFGRVGKVNPAGPDVSKRPSVTGVTTFRIATVVSTPLKVRVAALAPEPSVTLLVPEPEQASDRRQTKTPSVVKAPFRENESARATWLHRR